MVLGTHRRCSRNDWAKVTSRNLPRSPGGASARICTEPGQVRVCLRLLRERGYPGAFKDPPNHPDPSPGTVLGSVDRP
jgi:hypothetical protein